MPINGDATLADRLDEISLWMERLKVLAAAVRDEVDDLAAITNGGVLQHGLSKIAILMDITDSQIGAIDKMLEETHNVAAPLEAAQTAKAAA